MARYNYYGVKDDYAWHLATVETELQMRWYKPLLFRESNVVWCQGPRGGVRGIHVRDFVQQGTYGYVRRDSEAMKQFVWVKLRARDLGPK